MNYLVKTTDKDKYILHWQITKKCNYRCSYCIQGIGNGICNYYDELPILEQCKIINQCIDLIQEKYPDKKLELYLIGGEPTCVDLYEALSNIKPVRIHMVTNASRSADYYIDLCNTFKSIRWITFSVHQEYHNIDDFCEKIENIREYISSKVKISINITTDKNNYDTTKQYINKLRKIDLVKLNPTVIREYDGIVPKDNLGLEDVFSDKIMYEIDGKEYSRYEALEYIRDIDTFGYNCTINQKLLKIESDGNIGFRCHGQIREKGQTPEEICGKLIKCSSHKCNLCKTGAVYKDGYESYIK